MPTLPFLKKIMDFPSDGPANVPAKFEMRIALQIPEIEVLGAGCES